MFGLPVFMGPNSDSGCSPVDIAGASPPQYLTVGVPYVHDLNQYNTGGPATDWSVDTLPAGLSLNLSTGIISGTPTSDGYISSQVTGLNECSNIFEHNVIIYVDFYVDGGGA